MSAHALAGQARRLVHGIAGTWRRLEARTAASLRDAGDLTLDDLVFVETVAMTDLAPGEIATALRMPAYAVSRRLASLEGAGMLRRGLDPDDHRRRTLVLTPHGRAVLAVAQAALEARVAPILAELGPERANVLLDALTRLAAGADPDESEAGDTPQATPDAR